MEHTPESWAAKELHSIDLGDRRLNKRAQTLLERLAAKPTAGFPQACRGWGETMAAYRFLRNEQVDWESILEPHWQQARQRMAHHPVVLCLQDTTELDFNGRDTDGLGPLSYEAQRGMYLHPTYAVTPERIPLGVLDAWMWARSEKDEHGERHDIKESLRWIEGYERVAELAARLPQTRLVYVADREADIVALMQRAPDLGTPADWLIRSTHDRALPNGTKLWDAVTQGPALGEITFTMPARRGAKARPVRQRLWAALMALPVGRSKKHMVTVTCLVAREVGAPKGVKPVEWRLLSNRAAQTHEDVVELIDWYRARWEIEVFFNVLKQGCRVEALQLETIDRVERALALWLIVSWRIAYLMRMGRVCPELDAELFFDADEIRAAYLLNRLKPPAKPTVNEVLRLIARRGGFLARKGDGEPGAKTIWQGLLEVRGSALTLKILREDSDAASCV